MIFWTKFAQKVNFRFKTGYCRFLYADGNYSICLLGQIFFSYHICYENVEKYSRVKRQTDIGKSINDSGYFQLELNNMPAEKSVINN